MSPKSPLTRLLTSPYLSLLCIFLAWKAVLLAVAYCSPGLGYDTSTSLLFGSSSPQERLQPPLALETLTEKLTRWDGIYFASIAARGYVFEQEWAFGWGWTRFISFASKAWSTLFDASPDSPGLESRTAIAMSHLAHFLSACILYRLTRTVFCFAQDNRLAFISACLHILSPAGLFLSAPHAESAFSLLTLLGIWLFVLGSDKPFDAFSLRGDILTILSGFIFGISATLRSNGLFSGSLFIYEVVRIMLMLRPTTVRPRQLRRLAAMGAGGVLNGVGFLLPQLIAYNEYCRAPITSPDDITRPWCVRRLPSIYVWVQDQYWNVGFLRYWTLSNLPLFLVAAPMISILVISATWTFTGIDSDMNLLRLPEAGKTGRGKPTIMSAIPRTSFDGTTIHHARRSAMPQIILTGLTFTSAHVQIITRLSSASPVWYWWLASTMCTAERPGQKYWRGSLPKVVIRWMIIYGIVQGGLYASFLPPA